MKKLNNEDKELLRTMGIGLFGVVVFVAVFTIGWSIGAFILFLLWNKVICSVFTLPTITFVQAFAITFTVSIVKGIFGLSSSNKD